MTRALSVLALFVVLTGCHLNEQGVFVADTDPVDVIRSVFVENPDSAIGVARCESGLDPSAVSPDRANYGLLQINRVHRADFEQVTGQPWSSVLDAYWNTVYAKHLYDREGWRPWSCRWAA